MKLDLIATGGGRYRVLRNGREVSAHTQQHSAHARGIAEKLATPDALIEVVTDFRVRVEITGAVCASDPEPVDPPDPDPVDPEPVDPPDPDPVDPAEPEAPDPVEPEPVEPEPVEPVGDGLLAREAATMEPGEWRNISSLTTWPGKNEGVTFKTFQQLARLDGTLTTTDGMGWTQQLVEHRGSLMMILARGGLERALMIMDAEGIFRRVNQPQGFDDGAHNFPGGRRPFNRLASDGEYLYFAPADAVREMGYMIRSPLNNPGEFERVAYPFDDSQMDVVGNFAITYVPEWGRFYAYTPGGKIWSWAHNEPEWTLHGRLPQNADGRRPTGYAGLLLWNPVKQELAITGGQHFNSATESVSYMQYRLTEPLGLPEMMADRVDPDGNTMVWGSGSSKLIVDPRDGGYIYLRGRGPLYRAPDLSSAYELYEDISGHLPFGRYEPYCPFAIVPGTDVVAFISHIRGLVLHRLKPLGGDDRGPESETEDDEDDEDEEMIVPHEFEITKPDGGGRDSRTPEGVPSIFATEIAVIAQECVPGRIAMVGGTLPSYADTWVAFHTWDKRPERSNPRDHDTWGGIGFWDRRRNMSIMLNDRTHPETGQFNHITISSFLANSHSWRHHNYPNYQIGRAHVYCRTAYDDSRGHMYRNPLGNLIHRYSVVTEQWEQIPVASTGLNFSHIMPIAYNETLDALVVPDLTSGSRKLWLWQDGDPGWTEFATIGHSLYHSLMIYNRTRDDMLTIQNDSTREVRLIKNDGTVHEMPPVGGFAERGLASNNISYDPVTGNYLFRDRRKLWELNPEAEEWRLQRDWNDPAYSADWPGPYYGRPYIVIDPLGVILWQQGGYAPRVYKPLSAFA